MQPKFKRPTPTPDPYCAFKCDKARLEALRSRDRRLIWISALRWAPAAAAALAYWLRYA